jgi:hypothetical protein
LRLCWGGVCGRELGLMVVPIGGVEGIGGATIIVSGWRIVR